MAGIKSKQSAWIYPIIVAIVVVVLAICGVFEQPRVEKAEIVYGPGAQSKAQELGKTDEDFFRESGLYQRKMSEFDSFMADAGARIDYTYGYLYVAGVEKTGNNSIRLTLNCRTALAVLSGVKDAVVDENGIILELRNKNVQDGLVRISGLEQKKQSVGWKVELSTSDDSLLSNALSIARVISENGYYSVFTEITMQDNGQVRVMTSTGIPVVINLRYDVLKSLDIAYSILNKGVTTGGSIIVTGDKGYFSPDSGDTSGAKGM